MKGSQAWRRVRVPQHCLNGSIGLSRGVESMSITSDSRFTGYVIRWDAQGPRAQRCRIDSNDGEVRTDGDQKLGFITGRPLFRVDGFDAVVPVKHLESLGTVKFSAHAERVGSLERQQYPCAVRKGRMQRA